VSQPVYAAPVRVKAKWRPKVVPKPVKTSEPAEDMLRFDLDNENETIRNYRQRVSQCEALGDYALAEHIRDILVQEQDHQVALARFRLFS
jgi:bacterioferritin